MISMIYGGACSNPLDPLLLRNPYPSSLNSPLTYLDSLLCVVARIPVHSDPWLAVYWPPPLSSPFPLSFPQRFPISNTCPPTTKLRYRLHTVRYTTLFHFSSHFISLFAFTPFLSFWHELFFAMPFQLLLRNFYSCMALTPLRRRIFSPWKRLISIDPLFAVFAPILPLVA